VAAGATATFTVATTGNPSPTLRWQESANGGSTWTNLSNGGVYSGATTGTLSITGATAGMTGYQYRCAATNSVSSANSDAATLTITPSFASWQQLHFTSGELTNAATSGATAVFGADGLTNLVKYALGLDPKQDATAGLPVLTNNGTDWVYTYTRPADRSDLTYTVEVSTDLVNWTTNGVTHERVSTANGTEVWRGRYSVAGTPKLFARLRVTQIAP
jgi:hypothetical protein